MAKRTTTAKRSTRFGRADRGDEKVKVKETERTVPVKPVRAPRPGPTNPAAIDRRRQIVGTDELPKRKSR
jgi:hypothetical protein